MDHVQNYITAYYLDDVELEKWLRENYKVYRRPCVSGQSPVVLCFFPFFTPFLFSFFLPAVHAEGADTAGRRVCEQKDADPPHKGRRGAEGCWNERCRWR